MNTQTFFTILGIAFILIAYAAYLLLKPKKEKPKEQTTKYDVLNYQEKERLAELNKVVERQKELMQKPECTIQDATIVNLKATIESLKDQKQYLNRIIESKNRIIEIQKLEIQRHKDELGKAAFNVKPEFKKGDTIKGRPVPNGKKFIKGTIVGFSRREGNPKLDNGKTVYLEDAFVCG